MYEWEKDEIIIEIADAMIEHDWRLLDLVSNFEYSLTTIYKWLTKDLSYIDSDKFVQCKHIMNRHKYSRLPRGGRY